MLKGLYFTIFRYIEHYDASVADHYVAKNKEFKLVNNISFTLLDILFREFTKLNT